MTPFKLYPFRICLHRELACINCVITLYSKPNPPASKASREVANLTEKKFTFPCIWCQRIKEFATLAARAVFVSSFLL